MPAGSGEFEVVEYLQKYVNLKITCSKFSTCMVTSNKVVVLSIVKLYF